MHKRIKDKFAQVVQCGRDVMKAEAFLHDAETRLQLARLDLKSVEEELLEILPARSNVRTRLSFALAASATAEAILDQLV